MQRDQWPFSKPLEFLHKIKYGGAVGKQITAVIVALLVLAVVAVCTWGQIKTVYFVVPGVIVILALGLFSVQRTLDKHPSLATLEGEEYLTYRKIEMEIAAKGFIELPANSKIIANPSGLPPQLNPPKEADEE